MQTQITLQSRNFHAVSKALDSSTCFTQEPWTDAMMTAAASVGTVKDAELADTKPIMVMRVCPMDFKLHVQEMGHSACSHPCVTRQCSRSRRDLLRFQHLCMQGCCCRHWCYVICERPLHQAPEGVLTAGGTGQVCRGCRTRRAK